jgi:hypothetical protein
LKALNLPIEMVIAGHMSAVHGPDRIDKFQDMLAQYRE